MKSYEMKCIITFSLPASSEFCNNSLKIVNSAEYRASILSMRCLVRKLYSCN